MCISTHYCSWPACSCYGVGPQYTYPYPFHDQPMIIGTNKKSEHGLTKRFHDLLKEIADLHDKKQSDYGTTENPFANIVDSAVDFGILPWIAALQRANDKMKRLQKHASGRSLTNESAEDSFKDLAVYALIALVLYEDDKSRGNDSMP